MDRKRIERWQSPSFEWALTVLMFSRSVFGANKLFRESVSHSGLNDLL